MRNALLVAQREFAENAKTKGFWIGIFLFPVIILAGIKVPQFLEEKAVPTRAFVLVDESAEFGEVVDVAMERAHNRRVMESLSKYAQKHAKSSEVATDGAAAGIDLEAIPADIESMIKEMVDSNPEAIDAFIQSGGLTFALEQMSGYLKEDAPDFEEPKRKYRRVELTGELTIPKGMPFADVVDSLRPALTGSGLEVSGAEDGLFALALIPTDILAHLKRPGVASMMAMSGDYRGIEYWSTNLADTSLRDTIRRAVDGEVRRREYIARNVDSKTVHEIEHTSAPFSSLDPSKDEGEEVVSMADTIRQWAPAGFVYLLWIALMSTVQMLLNNTVEEKSNRIIEVLLSSVTPWELMWGKLIGIAGIGLTMLSAWLLSLVSILAYFSGPEAMIATQIYDVIKDGGLMPLFMIYFFAGYMLYAGIFLAIGSICSTLKEAQNFMGPVMIIMMVPIFTMAFIPRDPNGTLATVLSWVPLYTPFVMMNRAAADPPMFEMVGTSVVLFVSIIGTLWLSGKIFKTAILRTGQPPKLRQLWSWLRG